MRIRRKPAVSYKRGLAVVFACAIAAAVVFAATYPRFFASAPVVRTGAASGPAPASAPPAAPLSLAFVPLVADHNPLSWSNLTPAQHAALAPFASDWNTFSDERKRRWIKIASRFAKMSPEEQKRLHERMAEWVRMTPEQRRVARENYQVSKALPPQARQKAWKAYQELSPEQKARLAATERKRRPTIVSAPPTGAKSEIRGIHRFVDTSPGAAASSLSTASATKPTASAVPARPSATLPASAPSAAPAPETPSEVPSVFKGA
jgi:Protein of unknown function (DUF3106)